MKKFTITIALMLVVALAMPAFGASFSDVPSDHWSYNAINKLVAAGIVEGYPDGEYKGEKAMTRYEMAVMVSRALDNIVDEMEAMGEGLTTGQAEDVTAIVKSLMEKNTNDELSDAQAEEVADIVDALTFELRSELKVLGADVDALGKDVDELAAKVEAMDVPQDNIEFAMDVKTMAEVAYYGEDEVEERAVLELLQDGDAIDENFIDDPDLFPAQERFWQEYNFNIAGELNGAEFNLAVDTITNLFMDERSVLNYTENDDNEFMMDTALLEIAYEDMNVKMGDMPDYYPESYFLDEDLEGIEVTTNMYNTEFKAFAGGNDEDNDDNVNSTNGVNNSVANFGDAEMADEKYFGLTAERDTELGTFTGKVYHARSVVDKLANETKTSYDSATTRTADSPYDNTLVALGLENQITEALNLDGEIVYGQYEDENENDGSDMLANIRADYTVSEDFNTYGIVEYAGEDFVAARNDLEEGFGDYTLAEIGADYQLNENNNVNGFVKFVQAGDNWEAIKGNGESDDKMVVNVGLDNTMGKFTNSAFVEYADGDGFEKDHEYTLLSVGTDYEYDETMTMGANLNYKTIEKIVNTNQEDFRDYVYLTGYVDKQLKENVSWLTEVMFIDGTTDYNNNEAELVGNNEDVNFVPDDGNSGDDVDGTGYSLTTSLSVSF